MITSFYYVIIYLLCKDYFIEKVFRGHITIRLKMMPNIQFIWQIYSFEKTTNMLIYILIILILISIPSSL